MPIDPSVPTRGRSLVTRRALSDLVRAATLGSYGVIGLAGGSLSARLAAAVGLPPSGIRIAMNDQLMNDQLMIDLDLTVAHGVPVAEVARQVDSAVRYAVRRALDRDVDRLTIHVGGLGTGPFETVAGTPASRGARPAGPGTVAPDDLAASGTDVA
ncbi:MAG TPA: Asp23/Gls24 family envelope stress response protein [Candidatus Limnocylindrales bacterium]|nr:Asp23/Gls24 family envelope stress response protein [Candidatus Limnocylindrales bacterium]